MPAGGGAAWLRVGDARRWRTAAVTAATAWLVVTLVVDALTGPAWRLSVLYSIAPLIACAALTAAGTAGFAGVAVALALASGWWDHTTALHLVAVRMVDVVLVGTAAIAVAAVRVRREAQVARVVARAEAAERAAQAAANRLTVVLDTMLDAVTVGTAVRDVTGQIVDFVISYTNEASHEIYGKRAENITGHRWSDVFPERMGSELFARYVRLVETGEPVDLVDYRYHVPGPVAPQVRVVDLRVSRLGDGYVASWRDVTHRFEAARERQAAAQKFTAAFEHAPVGMMLLDGHGNIVRPNPALTAITGRRGDELASLTFAELVDGRDRPAVDQDLERLTNGEVALMRREVRLVTVDQTPRWVALDAARITSDGSRDGGSEDVVVHVEDIHDRKAYEGRLEYLADHDPLTGLFNRRRFHEELAHQVAVDARNGQTSCIALIDLDNFKYVNDTLGHATGDRLLQAIANSLRGRIRDSDLIGRLGGDEFAVLLPGSDEAAASAVAASLLDAVAKSTTHHAGQAVRSTASIGVASTTPEPRVDADDVLSSADLAMYAAKDNGRNTYVVFHPDSAYAARSRARFRWLDRVRDALEHDRFTLHAQPILDLETGTVTAAELLLRMREGSQLIPPDQFLYIAERHGLATAIDRFVINRGIAIAAAYPTAPGFRWEINLSADSLAEPNTSALIERALARTDLPASSLVFEITETAAIKNMDQAGTFAAQVADLGCRFALDDFGAGYGSFYYLKHLPFDYLKIDGEFIRELPASAVDQIVVEAIVTAARGLGKQTIAEYVGDRATLELLRHLQVDHAQGFLIGRPTDPAAALIPRPRPAEIRQRAPVG